MIKSAVLALFCLFCLALFSAANADTPLELSMKRIAKAYHQLALDLKAPIDASKADYVALATTMKNGAQKARDLVPKKAAELPADQQATMVAAYQKSMDDLSAGIDVLIRDLQASQWDAATKQLSTLKMDEDQGHKEFRKKEGKPVTQAVPPQTTAAPAIAVPATPVPATPAPASTPVPAPAAPNQ